MSASDQSLGASLKLYTLQTFYSGIVNVVMAVGTALVVWVGAKHVMSGKITVGEIIIFTTYLASLYGPMNTICQTWGVIQGAKVGVERVFEILEVEKDLKDGTRSFPKSGTRGEVVWENRLFQLRAEQPVLENINLTSSQGRSIALVGPTGVGKSTLVSLFLVSMTRAQEGSLSTGSTSATTS